MNFTVWRLALLGLGCAAVWAFIEIAEGVSEGGSREFDERLLLALRNRSDPADPIGPRWVEEMARDFTGLGGIGILGLITAASVVYLLMMRKRNAAVLVAAAVGGGILLSALFKAGFDRPRPDLVSHLSQVYTTSFPSGHSMMSAVAYLTLGALLAQLHKGRAVQAFILAVAILITVLVGLSRVYLGVHWPTDVLAGWAAGAAWACLCWLVAQWFQKRGALERGVEVSA
ncbi:MAG TPA: phosphatase PAP2 family protein [Burkholderiales bacterium]|nr:phosphatase PAP2 family protein [Burkholderiales bacterium]